jgi:hypothetical protein
MTYKCESMNNKILISILLFLVIAGTAAAATNDAELLKPGMGQAWLSSMGTDVQDVLTFILGGLVVGVLVAFVLFSGIAGIKIMSNSGNMGNPHEKSSGQTGIINVLIGLAAIVLFIKIGLKFFGWF